MYKLPDLARLCIIYFYGNLFVPILIYSLLTINIIVSMCCLFRNQLLWSLIPIETGPTSRVSFPLAATTTVKRRSRKVAPHSRSVVYSFQYIHHISFWILEKSTTFLAPNKWHIGIDWHWKNKYYHSIILALAIFFNKLEPYLTLIYHPNPILIWITANQSTPRPFLRAQSLVTLNDSPKTIRSGAGVAQRLCYGLPTWVRFPVGTVLKPSSTSFVRESKWAAVSKWPRCRWDVKHNQPTNRKI